MARKTFESEVPPLKSSVFFKASMEKYLLQGPTDPEVFFDDRTGQPQTICRLGKQLASAGRIEPSDVIQAGP
jgi:hypothetical protein